LVLTLLIMPSAIRVPGVTVKDGALWLAAGAAVSGV
jgi:hypothetical protein